MVTAMTEHMRFAPDYDWRALGLARQTGIEHWPGQRVLCDSAPGTVVRAVSSPTIVNGINADGEHYAHTVQDTRYDVLMESGELRAMVGSCHVRREPRP